jgi:hypothetical protein
MQTLSLHLTSMKRSTNNDESLEMVVKFCVNVPKASIVAIECNLRFRSLLSREVEELNEASSSTSLFNSRVGVHSHGLSFG